MWKSMISRAITTGEGGSTERETDPCTYGPDSGSRILMAEPARTSF